MKPTRLKLFAFALFLLAGSMAFIRSSHAQKPQAVTTRIHPEFSNHRDSTFSTGAAIHDLLSPRNLAPPQQGEKTVEQTRRNIQVLKGLPDSQLFIVMNFMRSSLGVSCAYCHVNSGGDKWEWEKDDKPTKVTARQMMRMQFALNQGNKDIFGTTGGVTCFTCHRGQTKPAILPPLPQAPPAGGPAGEARTETAPLPTVDEVLGKYVQGLGGEAAFRKLNTRMMKGAQITFDGTSIPMETYQAAPNKLVTLLTTPRQGVIMSGYNGTIGWAKNPRGQRELGGAQLEMMKRASDFYADLKPKETFPNLTVTGREKIGEREAYVLTSKASHTRTEKLYFDTQTGLLLRILAINQTLLAPIPEQTDFEDYRDVDGIKLPFTIRQSFVDPWIGWTRKYTEIKHNVPVDEAKFNPPPAPATAPK
jgi:Photosynthetic reaction centre cytochrome C subunit